MQLLRSLLKQISYESVRGDDDRKITDICCHSEKVKEGSLFVCINGYRNNGHEYVPQAVEHGAAVLVVDDRYVIGSRSGPVILTEHMKVDVHELIRDRNICVVTVRDTRKALSALSAAFFDHPAERMKMIGITGTNGKTTTTTLLGEIMKAYQDDVFVVGNIGNPYTVAADLMTEHSIAVAEMSSFQLESIVSFRPNVSAILNYTPDHLNRHHTMEAYIAAKENIARNQTEDDYCVLNYEEPVMRKFAETLKCHVLFFSSQHKLEKGIYLDNDKIIYKNPDEVEVCHVDELQILGTHNYENVMAAVCMAAVYGVPMETIRKAILAFKGVAHRIEYVAEKNGVVYYNDSKGTNPDAAIKAIQAMRRPTILLGGGYDKDSEYTEWINSFDGKVKKLILMGATKEKIARDCEKCDFHDYVYVDTFEEAMNLAVEMAEPGDAVLLSPACASWGMFPNYEVRGDKFKEIVNSL